MRKRILAAAMAVAVVAATLAFRLWPRTLSPVQCGEPYRRYAGSDIVRASFIKDKRINDSVSVDVTLLEAVGDSGWVVLQRDFGLPVIPKEYESAFFRDSNQVSVKVVHKADPSLPMDSVRLNNDVIAITYPRHTICLFSISNESQYDAVIEYNLGQNAPKQPGV